MIRESILFLILILYFPAIGLSQNITGKIEGRVIDSTGASLFRVNISLQSENLKGMRHYRKLMLLIIHFFSYYIPS